MKSQQIKQEDWREFFDRFSREHAGWLVAVEVMEAEIGAQVEAEALPLQGISADVKGGESNVALMLDVGGRAHMTHEMSGAQDVWLEAGPGESDETLQIRSADGTTTLLRFRPAMLPQKG